MKTNLIRLIILFVLIIIPTSGFALPTKATIYENEGCYHCKPYVEELKTLLHSFGITDVEEKFYINDPIVRKELDELNKKYEIPSSLQGHLVTVINNNLILEGHVPIEILREFLDDYQNLNFSKLVVYQDSMEKNIKSYRIMGPDNNIKECSITTSIDDCLVLRPEERFGEKSILPLIIVSGLIDGINPCAFAVLLFFISFLFTIQKTKKSILKVGIAYITMIYFTYLGIGLGLLKAITFVGAHHLMAKIGAYLVIFLGAINIKDYFWYGRWFSLKIPHVSKNTIERLVHMATLPSALILGFLVGLCTFPCTGGIYVAILGLLAVKTTFLQGLVYLLIYNIMFVIPLIIILAVASNKIVVDRITKWEHSKKKYMKLLSGIFMIILGIIILIWA